MALRHEAVDQQCIAIRVSYTAFPRRYQGAFKFLKPNLERQLGVVVEDVDSNPPAGNGAWV